MSIIATVIGFAILLIRKITNKKILPKCNSIIWIFFIITLIFPVSFPSKISIYNYVNVDDIKIIARGNRSDILDVLDYENDNTKLKEIVKLDDIKMLKDYLIKIIIPDIWFIVFIIKLIGVIYSYRMLTNGIGDNDVKDERIVKILERCKKKLKIKKNIKIIKQNLVKTPSMIGLFKVKILFTEEMLKLDDISINDVIMHELSHYKRKDNILNASMMIIKCVYWFNPIIKTIFKYIKTDMELATDEMAICKMEKDEQREYCKVVIKIAGMCNSKVEQVLGIASGAKEIEQRIDMIALKDQLEKYYYIIFASTIFIILLMCFALYPTSYGMYNIPKLYLKLQNGDKVEASVIESENDFCENTIKISKDESIELIIDGGKTKDYIFYNKIDLDSNTPANNSGNVTTDIIPYFQIGEYIYKFTLSYGNNENIEYAVKIIVE